MKILRAFLAGCLLIVLNALAFRPEEGFGVGFILGHPTGVSASLPIGGTNAFNAAIGYKPLGRPNLYLQAGYVWHGLFSGTSGDLTLEGGRATYYLGPAAFALLSRNGGIGVQAITGIDLRPSDFPLQFFLEVSPGIRVLPETAPHIDGGLGMRYYF